ncbi:MASE3 domain-containing protein [Halalkalibacter alkalisediminis]|uniref:histidine kinase n=1 Tax=Halalkalibacter alkalisediminis TaxID=935616 RepID=A0ABV6NLR6_9BACI|nr:MASE3 domain-containing protein [Halalkalibacter alkalisediminis]
MQFNKSEKNSVFLAIAGLALLFLIIFQAIQTNSYELDHHLLLHTTLELISIAVCVSIFIYGWLTFPYIQTRILLFIAVSFLTIAIFDVIHTFTYMGMSFFLEVNHQVTTWLWLMARVTEALAFVLGLYILNHPKKIKHKIEKYVWLVGFSLFPLITSYFIMSYDEFLPQLITASGTTILKKSVEYVIAIVHLGAIAYLWRKYKRKRSIFLLNLMRACFFLILCGVTVTLYQTGQDLTIVLGHVFKVVGYFFILKAFYNANIQAPFEDKKMTEEKLSNIESELELLFKNTDDAIFIYNLKDKKLMRRNPAFTKMFGYDEDLPLSTECLVPESRKGEFEVLISKLANGQPIIDYKTQRQHRDRTLLDVSMTVSPMKMQNGEIFCASIIRNITEERKAELQLLEIRRELEETLEQHQGVIFKFKKIDDVFIYTLIDGKVLRESGIIPEEVIGQPVQNLYVNSDIERFDRYNERAWNGEEVEFQMEVVEGLIYLVSLIPIKRDGEVHEVLGTVIDITTLIKTEELLRKTEKLSVVGELAAGFAHEIRNPLTTIKGFLQLLKKETNEKHVAYMSIMLNEIDRLEMITNEFMAVAKPQVANHQMEDLQLLTESVNQFLNPQALLKNVEMEMVVKQDIPYVYCDRNQLRQVFINIYKNAMEAMPNGGTITTVMSVEGECVSISITDEGSGIPESLIPRLGEPFYTLKEKGTGLGLMVSRKIIESHQGSLIIKSKVNVGTTMTINLPVDKQQ